MHRLAPLCLLPFLILTLLFGCTPKKPAAEQAKTPPSGTGTNEHPQNGTPSATNTIPNQPLKIPLRIYAASSLNPILSTLAATYRQSHAEQACAVTFGAADDLAARIVKSKGADIFISDSPAAIETLRAAGLAKDATIILGSQLQIVTSAAKPILIATPDDLKKPEIKTIGIAAGTTAEGVAVRKYLTDQKLLPAIQAKLHEYPSDAHVADGVAKGEVAVGFVFASTAKANREVKQTLSVDSSETPNYIVAPILNSENSADAVSFATILASKSVLDQFTALGFAPVEPRPLP